MIYKKNDIVTELNNTQYTYKILDNERGTLYLERNLDKKVITLHASQVKFLDDTLNDKYLTTFSAKRKAKQLLDTLTLKSKLTYEEALKIYVLAGGACFEGTEEYFKKHDINEDGVYSVPELLKLCEGQKGSQFLYKRLYDKFGDDLFNIIDKNSMPKFRFKL